MLVISLSNELIKSKKSATDVELFTNRFSTWASGEYKRATQGMLPSLLNSPGNRIEVMVTGYKKGAIPQLYVISNDPNQPALVPHLLDVPYHISGVASVGRYWLARATGLSPVTDMHVETLMRLPFLMIKETERISNAVSLPMEMVILRPRKAIERINEDRVQEISKCLDSDIDRSLLKLLSGVNHKESDGRSVNTK